MVVKKQAQVRRVNGNLWKFSWNVCLLWVLLLALKIVGIAFLVQGFVLQISTGILYFGLLHYAIGTIFIALAWHVKRQHIGGAACPHCA